MPDKDNRKPFPRNRFKTALVRSNASTAPPVRTSRRENNHLNINNEQRLHQLLLSAIFPVSEEAAKENHRSACAPSLSLPAAGVSGKDNITGNTPGQTQP